MDAQSTSNPFLKQWDTPFNAPPFNDIKLEHYLSAFEEGIKQQNSEIASVVSNKETPTFENTMGNLKKREVASQSKPNIQRSGLKL